MNQGKKGIQNMQSLGRNLPMVEMTGLLAWALVGWPSTARAGSLSYLVTVDSSGISGTSGLPEAELAASAPPTPTSVTGTISSVATDGMLGAVTFTAGDVSGSFSSTPLSLANDNATSSIPSLSDLQQAFTYGTSLSFELTLSGPEVMSANPAFPFRGTVFSFILEDSTPAGLNTGPVVGEPFVVYVNPSGGTLTVAPNDTYMAGGPVPGYSPNHGYSPLVTIAPVPEPSSLTLLGLGTLLVFGQLIAYAPPDWGWIASPDPRRSWRETAAK
jgi:hypothetical protein